MSKTFKRQDSFRYKRLGKKWRRPVGWQSKLRLRKAGSGMRVSIGYGTEGKMQATLVRNEKDLQQDCKFGIIIAASVGSKKAVVIAAKAKEMGITVLNMKKVHKAHRIKKSIDAGKKSAKSGKKTEEKKETHDHKQEGEHKHEHGEKKDGQHHEHKEGEHKHEHPHREADS